MTRATSSQGLRGLGTVGAGIAISRLIDWFIPEEIRLNRTDWALARTFVFTHIFGPLIAQPMWIYIYLISDRVGLPLVLLALSISSFWLLPLLLRSTKSMWLVSLVSFQGLAMTSLNGSYHYGGFNSPFLPWLVVTLMLGLFYLAKNIPLVISLFVLDVAVFLGFALSRPMPTWMPLDELRVLGWLSLGSATVYMTWMALYYSTVVTMKSEFEVEAMRSRATSAELERARAVAEENMRERVQFFSKMSHELRTPLNAIIGYSEILMEELDERAETGAARARDIRGINAAGKHLLSLVANVLDTDRIEDESVLVHPVRISLGQLCDEVVANARPMIERNRNTLVVHCLQADRLLYTDAKKLRQIAINLLGNAGKFTADGTVRLEMVIESGPHDDYLRMSVSDTGIGIAESAKARLFGEYQQADPSVPSRFGGTGIGLALSRQFCILLGGQISFVSEVGKGSTFTVTVPTRYLSDVEGRRTSPRTEGTDTGKSAVISV